MTKVWIKVQAIMQASREELLVATCDSNLLGKKIIDGKVAFVISKNFYGGELVDIEKMIKLLKMATIANIVGEECINAALSAGLIEERGIKKIKNVPNAQIFSMQ
jgi:hypothetical protein